MNLEKIDTSTTAGKAEVMRLASEGRRVVYREHVVGRSQWRDHGTFKDPDWDWLHIDYAIIAEPVGPEEVYGLVHDGYKGRLHCHIDKRQVEAWAEGEGGTVVRYIRADLAGEEG